MQENFVRYSEAMKRILPGESLIMEEVHGPKVPITNLYDKISPPDMNRDEFPFYPVYWNEARLEQKNGKGRPNVFSFSASSTPICSIGTPKIFAERRKGTGDEKVVGEKEEKIIFAKWMSLKNFWKKVFI
nr:hypothetical protein [Marseillevirus cajuinensis]